MFLTIQYLEEADELADRIGLRDQGRLVAEGARFGSCDRRAGAGAGRGVSDRTAADELMIRLAGTSCWADDVLDGPGDQ